MARGVAGGVQRIMHFFLPKEEDFFELFEQMAAKAHQAAVLLCQVYAGEVSAEDQRAPIADLEHEVDHLRHDCIQRLNNTFVTPIMFDRPDILDLSQALDDVVDNIRAAVDRTALYQPQSIPAPMLKLATILVECTEALAGACTELHALRTAGSAFIERVNTLENQGDTVLKQALADLFHHEPNAIEVIKWKEIYDYVEEAIDHCEDTVNVIEASLVKNS